jgi:hypothetical protein
VADIRDQCHHTIDVVRRAKPIYRSVDKATKPIVVTVLAGRRAR